MSSRKPSGSVPYVSLLSLHPRQPSPAELLRYAGVSALLITNLTNIRYLTGLQLSAGLLLVQPQGMRLFADARYRESAGEKASAIFSVRSVEEISGTVQPLRSLGFEAGHVTVMQLARWRKRNPNTKFIQCIEVVEYFRRRKRPLELRYIQCACRITRKVLRELKGALHMGMTERELQWRIACRAHALGAEDRAFNTIVAFGENTSHPHHRPTDRRLRRGDIVQVDAGVVVGGYCSDFSRVYFTAPPTREQRRALRALREAKAAATAALRPGVTNHRLYRIAFSKLQQHGYGKREFCHALGHGVGLEIHEGVSLSTSAPRMPLLPNEVITMEPGLYFPGQWGMRLEDTVIVR